MCARARERGGGNGRERGRRRKERGGVREGGRKGGREREGGWGETEKERREKGEGRERARKKEGTNVCGCEGGVGGSNETRPWVDRGIFMGILAQQSTIHA